MAIITMVLPALGSIALFATMGVTGPWLRAHAEIGIAAYIAGFAILSGLALLPTYAQSALGGFAFGVTIGIPAALAGFLGGSIIGYEIARRASGDNVERVIDQHAKLRAVRNTMLGDVEHGRASFWRSLGMVTLLRLPPNSPFAAMNLMLASVKVPRTAFLLGTLLGLTPRTALAVVIGAGVEHLTREELSTPRWVLITGIAVTIVVVITIGLIANAAIKRVTGQSTPPSR